MGMNKIKEIEVEREYLQKQINYLLKKVGSIPMASTSLLPYGWRKAAKGRTVWRIVEEVISQNLEKYAKDLGFEDIIPASSEVGVYDFVFETKEGKVSYVNIKTSVKGGRRNKDDISKAAGLLDFYTRNPTANLYTASFIIDFKDDLTVLIEECIVFPVSWIPDIYVNPSNNANLQSSWYKDLDKAEHRTNEEFLIEFKKEIEVARKKRLAKQQK